MGKLIIFTGAGISAESGISTFRGKDGLWEEEEIDKVCNYWTWDSNYDAVHSFYNARRASLAVAEPNAAHRAIAEWQGLYDTVILTQNIDDLLEKAGCQDVVHLHGEANAMRCIACGNKWTISAGYQWDPKVDECASPKCHCKKAIKPDVIFFNEEAPKYRIFNNVIRDLAPDDVILVMGTSAQVIPIHSYVFDKPGFKMINNLHAQYSDEGEIYDRQFYKPATEAVAEIGELIKEKLG
jgi:NAD-dependent deacetylase